MERELAMYRLKARASALLIGLSIPLGCSAGDGLARAQVRGEVRVDGEPLEEGSINFFPAGDAEGPSAGGVIAKGRYDIPRDAGPVVGKNRVEIRGVKKTGRMVPNYMAPGTMQPELMEALPPDVNTKSTLVRDIAAGTNVIDFADLKGQSVPPPDEKGKGKGKGAPRKKP
jgi:hypothetical protein